MLLINPDLKGFQEALTKHIVMLAAEHHLRGVTEDAIRIDNQMGGQGEYLSEDFARFRISIGPNDYHTFANGEQKNTEQAISLFADQLQIANGRTSSTFRVLDPDTRATDYTVLLGANTVYDLKRGLNAVLSEANQIPLNPDEDRRQAR